jgi:hypothetical protein
MYISLVIYPNLSRKFLKVISLFVENISLAGQWAAEISAQVYLETYGL